MSGPWRGSSVGPLAAVILGLATMVSAAAAQRAPASGAAVASRPAVTSGPSRPVATRPADFEADYRRQLESIKPTDAEGLYRLATGCSRNGRPDLAADACRRILATWPEHARARSLLRVSTQQLAAASRPNSVSTVATSRPASPRPGLLTAGAVNRLRFAEFDFRDMADRPRVVIPKAVIQEFLAEADKAGVMTAREKAQFARSDNDDKLRWIALHSGDRFVDRVQVNSDPRAITSFRQRVWPILSRGCASLSCHGGGQAGSLQLVLPATLPAASATNFYLVVTCEGIDGPLVNREQPDASLLLQYGLSPEQAQFKHPVPIHPLFASGTKDPKYKLLLEWIQSLRKPAPPYDITQEMFQPLPQRAGASRPAGPAQGTR